MKFSTSITVATLFALTAGLQAQTEIKPTISPNPAGWSMDWDGNAGETYFMQWSTDLVEWSFFPTIRSGDGSAISHGFNSSSDKFFTRVKWTDLPDGGDPNTADFDKDGLGSLEELLSSNQTDPLNSDTDGDQLLDGWEVRHGLLPNNSDSDGNGTPDGLEDPDGDGADNATEQGQEGDPNDPIDAGLPPLEVTGNAPQGIEATGNRTYSIPANGKSYLVVAYLNSSEYPEWTSIVSEFDDVLRWDINPSNGTPISGSVSVNTLHDQWAQSDADGTGFNGYSPIAAKPLGIVHSSTTGTSSVYVEIGVTNVADDNLPSRVMIRLEPIEVKDVNGDGQADDVTITHWDTNQAIDQANVAWIDAHTSAQNSAPRMPQLELSFGGFAESLPEGYTIEAKLLVNYERPYVGQQNVDTVQIPANGNFTVMNDNTWEIYNEANWINELNQNGFFGGDATITFQIKDDGNTIFGPSEIKFAIGGENPDDDRCRAYTQGLDGAPWYAYAIERHESQAYVPGGHYNQFWEHSGNSTPINAGVNYEFTIGDPLKVLSPGENGVGGTGLAQVTGDGGDKNVPASRDVFWNWQSNVDAFMSILAEKIDIAEDFMNDPNPRNPPTNMMPDGQRPQTVFHTGQNVPVPSRGQADETFGDNQGERRPEDAVAIKAYNGAAAHWCSWRGPTVHEWQWNYGQNNYVEVVCEQIQP